MLIGEIGGREEEAAAEYLVQSGYEKPVIALIVGRHAPASKRMGHAGTLSPFAAKDASAKIAALEGAGVMVAANACDVVGRLKAALDPHRSTDDAA